MVQECVNRGRQRRRWTDDITKSMKWLQQRRLWLLEMVLNAANPSYGGRQWTTNDA